MIQIGNKVLKLLIGNHLRRQFHQATILKGTKTYEGEGKTKLNILNNEADVGLMINGFSQVGFRLNNDITVLGPMIIFPRSVLSWNIEGIHEINEESLSLFAVLEPKIDIVVLGIGDQTDNYNFFKSFVPFSRKHRIAFEVMPTEHACSTFNFLSAEGRNVAGAMIPPQTITTTEDDELQTKLRYNNLYGTDL